MTGFCVRRPTCGRSTAGCYTHVPPAAGHPTLTPVPCGIPGGAARAKAAVAAVAAAAVAKAKAPHPRATARGPPVTVTASTVSAGQRGVRTGTVTPFVSDLTTRGGARTRVHAATHTFAMLSCGTLVKYAVLSTTPGPSTSPTEMELCS